ncbi:O-antigen export system, permease protein [hydrothermal vent metagenome]|uniref:O-antigen export system, permease protein n=1 Tax=hydrothermal vent metagenome TaxID=652676 RepID=A0A3B0ZW96_9ZZZZ
MDSTNDSSHVTVITPPKKWEAINFRELFEYRDLFYFLVWRDIKVLYAQTVLGFGWAILQPLIQIILFTLIFGKVAQIPSDGIPYFLFATVAVVPWTYMSSAMTSSSQSLVTSQNMLGKVYFPRLIYPLTPVLTKLVDFGIALVIVLVVMIYYQVPPTWNLAFLPIFILMMIAVPAGVGLWLSSLSIRFRDVRFAMGFTIQMLMYSAPIVYSASSIPDGYRFLYSLNPIVGVIEGFRASLLGTPIPWVYIIPGMVTVIILVVSGAIYFRKSERVIVDVI